MMAVNDMDVLNAITKYYPTVAKNTGQRQAASNGQFDMRSRWHGGAEKLDTAVRAFGYTVSTGRGNRPIQSLLR